MANLDFPVGDGEPEPIKRLLDDLYASLIDPLSHVTTLTAASEEETDWLVSTVINRGISFGITVSIEADDPLLSMRRIADPEHHESLYALPERCCVLVRGVHHIDKAAQNGFGDLVGAFCAANNHHVLITGTSPIPLSPSISRKDFQAPSFPATGSPRFPILNQLLRVALAREGVSLPPASLSTVVDAVSRLALKHGLWQADAILSHVVAGIVRDGRLATPGAVSDAFKATLRRRPARVTSVASIRNELARLDAGVTLLNNALKAVVGREAFDLAHLPHNPDFCSSPSHWFEAVVTRWYAFYYDGGPRLKFLSRIEVRPNGDLVHRPRPASRVPELLQSLRTWQVHGLNPSAPRAQQQRAESRGWFDAKCGTSAPDEYQWRRLTVSLIAELEQYLSQVIRAAQSLRRYPSLISDMNTYVQNNPPRNWN